MMSYTPTPHLSTLPPLVNPLPSSVCSLGQSPPRVVFSFLFPGRARVRGWKEATLSACDSCPLCYADTDSSLSSEDELETSWGQKSGSYVEEPPERKTFPTLVQVCYVCRDRVGG